MDSPSERRLVENEVIFREANKSIAEFVKESSVVSAPLRFYCECSRPECRERIELTPEEYKELHQSSRQFIALNGHEIPEIEKIILQDEDFNVIEKFAEPPTPEELNRAVKKIIL